MPFKSAHELVAPTGRLTVRTEGTTRTYTAWLGWNPQAQYTGTVHTSGNPPAITRCYSWLWGLDLSETPEGAGGVGGLLAQCIHTATNAGTYYPLFDGNGNVTQYLKQGVGTAVTLVAHFDYDPFGRFAATPYGTASLLADLPYRFSTKPLDPVTGLCYYGYRWYDPLTGRWPSRDPIGELGGMNLYGFLYNSTPNWIDRLGLDPLPSVDNLRGHDLAARSTEAEYDAATRIATRNGILNANQRDRILREKIMLREKREGIAVTRIIKIEEKNNGCECAKARIRTRPKSTDAPPIPNPFKPLAEVNPFGDWVNLDEAAKDPKNMQAFDHLAVYEVGLFGGTCDSYNVRIGPALVPGDELEVHPFPDMSGYEHTNALGVPPDRHVIFNGSTGGEGNPLTVSRNFYYKKKIHTSSEEAVHYVVKVSISGFRKGNNEPCCNRTYYIKGK